MALNFPDSPTLNQVYTDSTSGFSYQWNGTVWISYTPSSSGNIRTLDDISSSFNGSTQTFPLTSLGTAVTPANPQSLVINLGGVVQDPTDDYTISGSNIIFSTAPANGLSFSGILLGVAVPVGISTGDVYFRQTYFPVGVQTSFVFVNGYTSGYLDVYKNGVKLLGSTDYTATDGINFSLTSAAQLGDEIEAIGYRVSSIAITNGSLNALSVSGDGVIAGILTVGSLTSSSINSGSITSNSLTVGVITATTFEGSLGNVGEKINNIGNTGTASTINLDDGTFVTAVLTGDCTFTFTNPSSEASSFTLLLTNDGTAGRSITWPVSVKWPGGSVPLRTTTANKTDVYTFFTTDSGTNWYGNLAQYNYS